MAIRWHEDDPTLLREAMQFTAAETGFIPRLIEKDYFCSVLLEFLAASEAGLTFKGGTCLSKVHGSFYRLSEDLDFSISTPLESSRAERSGSAEALKAAVDSLPGAIPVFRIIAPVKGANNSTQYKAAAGYDSPLGSGEESISIEVGLREPLMTEREEGAVKTVLLNPVNREPLVEAFPIRCLPYIEAMAEKLRAALCRREVAIRDFFDIDHAVANARLNVRDDALLALVRRKLEIPGTGPVDVSPERMEQLQRQLDAQLRPVLREQEFAQFDLERAVETVRAVAGEVTEAGSDH